MAEARITIVDDHLEMARVLGEQLSGLGYAVDVFDSGESALEAARTLAPDLVITDLRMAGMDGLELLAGIRAINPGIPVLIMTAFAAVEPAIEAMKRGAYHYFTKPLRLAEVSLQVDRALADRRLKEAHRALVRIATERTSLGGIIGRSRAMLAVFELIERAAPSPAPVLVCGESGTGKELVARALHYHGPRRDRPFVAVNCTALPETLLESELFGHARGAFTGAVATRRGLFLEADGGTLFLDEIGDMAPALQARLLRVLEDGQVRAIGSDTPRRVDVRVVAATHQKMEERIRSGQFRSDLFYRLNVIAISVPPLRSRAEDVPLLVERFLARSCERNPSSPARTFSPELVARLATSPWPGNVRELENVVERLVVVASAATVTVADLDEHVPQLRADSPLAAAHHHIIPLRQLEDDYIAWAVAHCGGNKTKAAELLGIDVSTIYRRERQAPR